MVKLCSPNFFLTKIITFFSLKKSYEKKILSLPHFLGLLLKTRFYLKKLKINSIKVLFVCPQGKNLGQRLMPFAVAGNWLAQRAVPSSDCNIEMFYPTTIFFFIVSILIYESHIQVEV